MHRLETSRDGKLRAACDRCHDLKNRCVRAGGPDSRCNRCERLDIDCVYRNSSRMGRPKAQRRASVASRAQSTWEDNYQDEPRETDVNRRRDSDKRPSDTSICTAGINSGRTDVEVSTSGSTTINDSPSDILNFLVAPEVTQQPDMDWSQIDSSHPIDGINEPLYHAPPGSLPAPDHVSFPQPNTTSRTERITDRLFQLQGQLHRLLSTTDQQPAVDFVEEGLEVTKSFLEILQASMSSCIQPADSQGASAIMPLPPDANNHNHNSVIDPRCRSTNSLNFIGVQQALICYSYILHMLDRVIDVLASDKNNKAGGIGMEALSLGLFNLASQPALNSSIVLHIVMRMLEHLRLLIQQLAPAYKDRPRSPSDSAVDTSSGDSPKLFPPSIAVTSHAVADLVSDEERALVDRLSCLTSGP